MRPTSGPPTPSRFNISRWALEHPALTRYLMVVLMVLGVAAYFQLGQDEDPPFTFRAMVVQAYWPGASALQMAEQVTDKIEKTLQEVPYADRIRSFAKPGESLTIFQLKDSAPPKEVAASWYQVRKRIGDMRGTLPQGVIGPVFNDDFGDVYGSIFAMSADSFSREELREFADRLRQRLLRVPDVAKVEVFGAQPEKLFVEISHKRLAQLGLDFNQVIAQIGAQNAVEGAGVLNAGTENLQVRVGGQFNSVEELQRFAIRAVNPATGVASSLRLGDIAEVRRGYVDPPAVKVRHQGQEVIALGVAMVKGGDILALGEALAAAVAQVQQELPLGITVTQVQDQPRSVSRSVGEFVKVLVEAVLIVLAVSFVSLGLSFAPGSWKPRIDIWPGLVVGITIPLVLAITFVTMYYWGIGLHKISLGSLIIALGLLVDDAIIAVEMMVRKLEEGYDKMHAATYAYDVTAMPMLTGTLITAAGFLPIGLAKSVTGEYTFAIFAVTSAALVISWLVSVYFVPYLGARLLHTRQAVHGVAHEGELFDTPFYARFRRTVDWCVQHRWITIGLTLASFALGIAGMGRVQQQFFPDSVRPELVVDLWLPEGSTVQQSEVIAQRFEARLMQEPGVASVTTWIGSGVPRFYLPLDQVFPQGNVSQAILLPRSLKEREALRVRLPELLATEFPEVRGRVKLLPNGPPVAYPVQFRVVGTDAVQVRAWADRAKLLLREHPAMRGVNDNWNEAVKVLRLHIDQDKARALGVTSQALAQASRTILSGTTIGQYREGDKLIDIVLRQPLDERKTITDLGNAYLPTSSGRSVPLTQIARIDFTWEPGVIWREGRNFAVTLQGDVVEGVQGPTVTAQLAPHMQALAATMPAGYTIQTAGATEESSKGQGSLLANVPLMGFIMLTLLMLQLQSFSRAMLVMLTAPLGIAGVAAALLLLDRPFGFVALLGVIALMGMIQRNSVIL
ncbi:MAG: efflux RND transporter permease subunit, partial [Rubrivivax sp.]|nr:efflux RND transporter permease subunit [Rubrivivax sp.]